MGKNASTRNLEMARAWEALQTILPPELLHAPLVNWDEVNPALLRYLYTQVREAPWLPHLAFCGAILTCHTRLDRASIQGRCYHLHARFRVIFPHYHLSAFEQWKANEHMQRYLNDTELSDSLDTRQDSLHHYHVRVPPAAAYLR